MSWDKSNNNLDFLDTRRGNLCMIVGSSRLIKIDSLFSDGYLNLTITSNKNDIDFEQ